MGKNSKQKGKNVDPNQDEKNRDKANREKRHLEIGGSQINTIYEFPSPVPSFNFDDSIRERSPLNTSNLDNSLSDNSPVMNMNMECQDDQNVSTAGAIGGVPEQTEHTDVEGNHGSHTDKLLNAIQAVRVDLLNSFSDHEKSMDIKVVTIQKTVDFVATEVKDVKVKSKENEKKITQTNKDLDQLRGQNVMLEKKLAALERHSFEFDLLIYGVPEGEKEDCVNILERLFKERFKISVNLDIEFAHRLGKKSQRSRPIICRFVRRPQKFLIKRRMREVGDETLYCKDHLIKQDYEKKKGLREIMNKAYKQNKHVVFRKGELYINGNIYEK